MSYGSAPGPTIKKALCHTCPLGGAVNKYRRSISVLSEQYETSYLFYVTLSFLCNIICYLISVFVFSLVTLSGAPTYTYVREKPVKSVGRLYSILLIDRHRSPEVQNVSLKGLKSIDKTCLPGKIKAWCYEHSLLTCLFWPLQMCKIALSRVERIPQFSN